MLPVSFVLCCQCHARFVLLFCVQCTNSHDFCCCSFNTQQCQVHGSWSHCGRLGCVPTANNFRFIRLHCDSVKSGQIRIFMSIIRTNCVSLLAHNSTLHQYHSNYSKASKRHPIAIHEMSCINECKDCIAFPWAFVLRYICKITFKFQTWRSRSQTYPVRPVSIKAQVL